MLSVASFVQRFCGSGTFDRQVSTVRAEFRTQSIRWSWKTLLRSCASLHCRDRPYFLRLEPHRSRDSWLFQCHRFQLPYFVRLQHYWRREHCLRPLRVQPQHPQHVIRLESLRQCRALHVFSKNITGKCSRSHSPPCAACGSPDTQDVPLKWIRDQQKVQKRRRPREHPSLDVVATLNDAHLEGFHKQKARYQVFWERNYSSTEDKPQLAMLQTIETCTQEDESAMRSPPFCLSEEETDEPSCDGLLLGSGGSDSDSAGPKSKRRAKSRS